MCKSNIGLNKFLILSHTKGSSDMRLIKQIFALLRLKILAVSCYAISLRVKTFYKFVTRWTYSVWILDLLSSIRLYCINWSVFVTETEKFYCAVWSDVLTIF